MAQNRKPYDASVAHGTRTVYWPVATSTMVARNSYDGGKLTKLVMRIEICLGSLETCSHCNVIDEPRRTVELRTGLVNRRAYVSGAAAVAKSAKSFISSVGHGYLRQDIQEKTNRIDLQRG